MKVPERNLLNELRERFLSTGPPIRLIRPKRGELILRAGDRDTDVYYVRSGTLRIYQLLDGGEQTIRFGYAGDFTFALDAFFAGRPTVLYIQALRRCELRVIPAHRFRDLAETETALYQEILTWLILGQQEREIDLLTPKPEDRYRRVLERSPRLFQEVPLKYIANYLRMTPETLSRCRKS